MPSDSNSNPTPDALVFAVRALALTISLVLAGCQSTSSLSLKDNNKPLPAPLEQQVSWEQELSQETPHTDIWNRIRDGFQLQEHLTSNPRIEQQRLLLAGRTRSIEMASERGSPYIHYIVEQLEERNMPLELALLPVIESSYNPFAYSPAKAMGLWQFMPATGRHFNLHQTHWYDGRRDITASTTAALHYLSYLHGLFSRDWLLALAAYNAGEGTVSRAIERNQRLGLPTDYWNLPLPAETRDYVPKLLALSQIVDSPEAYGLNLNPIANEPYFEAVALKRKLNLATVAKMADIDEEELYQLNPAFTRRIMLDGPQHLLVPADKVEMLEANLALMKPQDEIQWQQYSVRAGDTLGSIANRNHVTVKVLKEINRLRNDHLRIGQVLSIPRPADIAPTSEALHAVARSEATPTRYQVRSGDNPWSIARAHKLSVRDLQRWNNLSGSSLKVGQTLVLSAADAQKPSPTYYKVRKGDSFYDIAKRFNVGIDRLRSWNPIDSSKLQPGQKLTLYLTP